jgi:hypothetical protein
LEPSPIAAVLAVLQVVTVTTKENSTALGITADGGVHLRIRLRKLGVAAYGIVLVSATTAKRRLVVYLYVALGINLLKSQFENIN